MDALKVIFLDVDGVLISEEFSMAELNRRFDDSDMPTRNTRDGLDSKAIKRLNTITDITGARLVLSSSWRHRFSSTKEMQDFFKENGVKGEFLGMTPTNPDSVRYAINECSDKGWIDRVFRGHEIHAWILLHQFNGGELKINNIVILDDGDDMAYLSHRLVQTTFLDGLDTGHMGECLAMLGALGNGLGEE